MSHLLDVKETAERLNTTQRHVREMIARRAIPYLKVGRLVRFDADELAAWLDEHRVPAKASG